MALLLRRVKPCRPFGLSTFSEIVLGNRPVIYKRESLKNCVKHYQVSTFSTLKGPSTKTIDIEKLLKGKEESSAETVTVSDKINDRGFEAILKDLPENMKSVTMSKLCSVLSALSKLYIQEEFNLTELHHDLRFQNICNTFEHKCKDCSPVSLIIGLKSLLELKMDPNLHIMASIENELLWQTRKMSLKSLTISLMFHENYQATEIQKKVFREILSMIQKRWIEIDEPTTVLKIFEKETYFPETFKTKLEDRALEMAEKMTAEELLKFFNVLSKQKRRPTPLLRSLSYHLNQKLDKLTIKQSVDLLHALRSLNFPDVTLLPKICSHLQIEINDSTKSNHISSILTCLGQLRWKNPDILDVCCHWIINNSDSCRPQEGVACVLTLARLNYVPENANKLFQIILSKLDQNSLPNLIWLDVVWSLCILSQADENHVASVLKPSFYEPLLDLPEHQIGNLTLKFLNVIAVVQTEFPTIKLDTDSLLKKIQEKKSSLVTSKSEKKAVLDALNNFVPRGKFLATNLFSNLGFVIDAEFIVDQNGKPLPIIEYGVRAGSDLGLKPLPKGSRRIALLVWDYKDIILNSSSLSGKVAFSVRMLEKHNYSIIEVFLEEFNTFATTVKRAQFLQQKIEEKLQIHKTK